jgi:hypothetical protein
MPIISSWRQERSPQELYADEPVPRDLFDGQAAVIVARAEGCVEAVDGTRYGLVYGGIASILGLAGCAALVTPGLICPAGILGE